MKKIHRIISFCAAAFLFAVGAQAESFSFQATVVPKTTCEVFAPLGGMVSTVAVTSGDRVEAGQTLAELRTEKLISPVNGTVTAVFGQAGQDCAALTAAYGAVIYIDPDARYTVSGSLSSAYSSVESTYVSPGQPVWLVAQNNNTRTGTGIITSMDESAYTVQVNSGDFIVGESVYLYNAETRNARERIGSGSIARTLPVAIAPEAGTLVGMNAAVGDHVAVGDLLAETLSGTAEKGQVTGSSITAPVSGVVAAVSVSAGTAVEDNAPAAVIYPNDAMQLQGFVPEDELALVRVGAQVQISFLWNEDSGSTVRGTVSGISAMAETDEDGKGVWYRVAVDFEADANTRYGMTAEVSAD